MEAAEDLSNLGTLIERGSEGDIIRRLGLGDTQ
jgi:hypothetical protein